MALRSEAEEAARHHTLTKHESVWGPNGWKHNAPDGVVSDTHDNFLAGYRTAEEKYRKLLIKACDLLEGDYPIKGPSELADWWEKNRPKTFSQELVEEVRETVSEFIKELEEEGMIDEDSRS